MSFPLGEIASLSAAACWAVGLNLFRRDAREIGPRPVNLFKAIVALPLLLASLLVSGRFAVGDAPGYLAVSGVVGVALGDSLLFFALAHLGAHRAALFGTLGPVLTAIGAFAFLGERLSAQQLAGVAAATAGVAMVVYHRTPTPASRLGLLLGVLSAACQAAGVLLAKRGLVNADPLAATTVRLTAALLALTVVSIVRREFGADWKQLSRPRVLRRLIPAGIVGTFLGLWLMTTGIKYTHSAIASALHSTTPLFTLPIALFWHRESVGLLAVSGSFVAVGGVFLLLL
jgi:drug/metabolite transporter (DMT)-like permease